MNILVNNLPVTLPDHCSIDTLLIGRDLHGKRVAVEVNGAIVPRGQHASHALKADDRVEIVHALGGG